MSAAGYSGRPVAAKLGFKPGAEILLDAAPENYMELIAPVPRGVDFVTVVTAETSGAHIFVRSAAMLQATLAELRERLDSSAFVWVSWPKKASKVKTDVTEDTIRDVALPLGYVDVKVCAVSETWSGLKLVVRKALR